MGWATWACHSSTSWLAAASYGQPEEEKEENGYKITENLLTVYKLPPRDEESSWMLPVVYNIPTAVGPPAGLLHLLKGIAMVKNHGLVCLWCTPTAGSFTV